MEAILQYLERLGKEWDTVQGLKDHSILVGLITIALSSTDRTHLIIWLGLGWLALTTFYLFWKIKRQIKFIMFKRINLVFCFHNATRSEKIEKYILNFRSTFLDTLRPYGLNKLKVSFLPSDRQINSRQEAEKLIQSGYAGQTLLVWGDLTETDEDIRCRNTNFTYEFTIRKYFPKQTTKLAEDWFTGETKKRIDSYNWNLNFKNRVEIEAYTDNVKDIAIYTLARTLFSAGKVDEGLLLLSKLYEDLTHLAPFLKTKRTSMISAAKNLLSFVHQKLAEKAYYKKQWSDAKKHTLYALNYNPTNYASNIAMAYFQEMVENNELEAKKYLQIAGNNHKHGQNSHLIGKAYFHLKHEEFPEAVDIYKKLKRSVLDTNLVMLVENLREEYDKNKQHQFLFAEGFIKTLWIPNENGKSRLKLFIRNTESQATKFKILREEADLVLNDPAYKEQRYKPKYIRDKKIKR